MKGYLRHLRCQTRAREALGRASRPAWRRGDIASAWPTHTPDNLPRLSPFQGCMRLCARRAADAARSVALNGGRVILEGVAMRASSCPERLQPTRCGRIYPEELLRAVVSRYAERVSRGVAFGELGHPDPEHAHAAACCLGDVCCVRASSLSHRVTRLRWDGDELRVTAELLPTPAGMALRSLVLAGAQVCFSSRGLATLRPMDKGLALVGDDFELVAFDATPEPPHEGAVALAVPYDVAAREARLLAARTALLAARRPSNLLGEIKNLEPSLLDRIVEFVVNEGATDCAQ